MSDASPIFGQGELAPEALAAANIHPETGLATDYLNHFNEVVMLMEMLPDMPDCAEDVLDWEPASYVRHFESSAFKDKDLAIKAWDAGPHAIRAHFETLVNFVDEEVLEAQEKLRGDVTPDTLSKIAVMATEDIKPMIGALSGAIHGTVEGEAEAEDDNVQADIDALFD